MSRILRNAIISKRPTWRSISDRLPHWAQDGSARIRGLLARHNAPGVPAQRGRRPICELGLVFSEGGRLQRQRPRLADVAVCLCCGRLEQGAGRLGRRVVPGTISWRGCPRSRSPECWHKADGRIACITSARDVGSLGRGARSRCRRRSHTSSMTCRSSRLRFFPLFDLQGGKGLRFTCRSFAWQPANFVVIPSRKDIAGRHWTAR